MGTSKQEEVIYIEYLAVAPWNRAKIQMQKFKGLGKIMMALAVSYSSEKGMEGRCGLHSLPQAENFYSKIGMVDCGFDSSKGMKYYEFTQTAAKQFMGVKK